MVTAEAASLTLLVLPATAALGLAAAGCVVAFFAGATGWLIRRGITVPCQCFGTSTKPMGAAELVRNLLLTAVSWSAALALFLGARPAPSASDGLPAAVLGVALALVVVRLDDVVELFRPLGRPS